jgi:hypothetical protein
MTEQLQNNSEILPPLCQLSFSDCGVKNISQESLTSLGFLYPNQMQVELIPQILSKADCIVTEKKEAGKTSALILGVASKLGRKKTSLLMVVCKDKSYIDYFKICLVAFVKKTNFRIIGDIKDIKEIEENSQIPTVLFQTYEQIPEIIPYTFDSIICDDATHPLFEEKISQLKVTKYKQLITCASEDVTRFAPQIITSSESQQEDAEPQEFVDTPKDKSTEKEDEGKQVDEKIKEYGLICETKNKYKILLGLLEKENPGKVVVFVNTKVVATWLEHKLQNNGYKVIIKAGKEQRSRPSKPPMRGKERGFVREREPILSHALIASSDASSHNSLNLTIHFDVYDNMDFREEICIQEKNETLSTINYYLICEDYCHFFEETASKIPATKWHEESLLEVEDKQPPKPTKEIKYSKKSSTKYEPKKSSQVTKKLKKVQKKSIVENIFARIKKLFK